MAFMFEDRFPTPTQSGWNLHPAKADENLLSIIRQDRIAEFEVEFDRPAVLTINGCDKLTVSDDTKMVEGRYSFRHRAVVQDMRGRPLPMIRSISFDREVWFRVRFVVIV